MVKATTELTAGQGMACHWTVGHWWLCFDALSATGTRKNQPQLLVLFRRSIRTDHRLVPAKDQALDYDVELSIIVQNYVQIILLLYIFFCFA